MKKSVFNHIIPLKKNRRLLVNTLSGAIDIVPGYYCEYLETGYSNNMAKLLTDNPHGYLAYIEQRLKLDERFIDRYKDTARYIAMAKYTSKKKIVRNSYYKVIAFLAYPLGMVLYRKRYKKYL